MTYLLGVGDRHLDNLLLSPDGHFFHGEGTKVAFVRSAFPLTDGPLITCATVDFGYILGRDPKPFPPAVKVCKEMVDAMGGMQSPHYARFKSLCYTGFTTLRKNANLLINLVALMVDGNIPDIKLEPDKAVMKVCAAWLSPCLLSGRDPSPRHFHAGPGQVPSRLVRGGSDQGV